MSVTITIFDWELKIAEEIVNRFPELEAKFSPKKKVLKFDDRNAYEFFITELNLKKDKLKYSEQSSEEKII